MSPLLGAPWPIAAPPRSSAPETGHVVCPQVWEPPGPSPRHPVALLRRLATSCVLMSEVGGLAEPLFSHSSLLWPGTGCDH